MQTQDELLNESQSVVSQEETVVEVNHAELMERSLREKQRLLRKDVKFLRAGYLAEKLDAPVAGYDVIAVPDYYQSRSTWTNVQASKFIESLLLEIETPALYAARLDNDCLEIIDGLQRIQVIKNFQAGKFRLQGLDLLSELNDMEFAELTADIQDRFLESSFRVVVFERTIPVEVKKSLHQSLHLQ